VVLGGVGGGGQVGGLSSGAWHICHNQRLGISINLNECAQGRRRKGGQGPYCMDILIIY